MKNQFTPALLAKLAAVKEIDIETRAETKPPHRRPIWIVVVGNDAYIRSYRGADGVWYKQIRKNPDAVMIVENKRVPIHARMVRAPETIAQVSAEYLRKYKKSRSAQAMVLDAVLSTTLRVTPRAK